MALQSESCSDRRKARMAEIRGHELVGLVVVVLGFMQVVDGLPFPAPKINDCMSWEGCCPPRSNAAPIPFTFPSNLQMRTRLAAHLVDANYIAKYRKAYALMKKLPSSDPRSLAAQARLHCAYCGAAFTYPESQYALEIHDGWFFFPWHRMFLYFHERILASLIGDPSFTLPFWNWDNQSPTAPQPNIGAANSMPTYYAIPKDKTNSLWDLNRNRCALPPNIIDLNSGGGCSNLSPRILRRENTRLVATQMRTATTPQLFFGSTYRFGWSGGMGGGNLEGAPHGTVHVFTGNPNARSNPFDDMGNLDRAALDPLFYAHHANIDRLWEVWKTAGGRGNRVDITDKDYRNSQFIFYDENKKLVSMKVSQVLVLNKLRYNYQNVVNPWMTASSQMSSMTTDPMSGSMPPSTKCAPLNQDPNALIKKTPTLPKKATAFCTKPLTFRVRRADLSGKFEEVLAFKKLAIDWTKTVTINAYLFYPGADGSSLDCMEFFGTFSHIPQANHRKKQGYTRSWKLGLSAKLDQLGFTGLSHVVVTLMQVGSSQRIQFASAIVEKDK